MTWFIGQVSQNGPASVHDAARAVASGMNAPFLVPMRTSTFFAMRLLPQPTDAARTGLPGCQVWGTAPGSMWTSSQMCPSRS